MKKENIKYVIAIILGVLVIGWLVVGEFQNAKDKSADTAETTITSTSETNN